MASPEEVISLDVVLTAGCNLSCAYCYQNAKENRRMSWETLRESVDLLLRSERKEITLTFYGGEPLLEFPMIRRAVEYAERVKKPGRDLRYALITNGTLMRADTAAFLAAHHFKTQLSFDGVAAAQDLRGRGTFPVLDALLDRLRLDHPLFFRDSLKVALTLISSTIPHLARSIRYFLRKGVQDISISPAVTHDGGWKVDSIVDLERQISRVFRYSVEHYRRTGEVPFEVFRRTGRSDVHDPRGRSMCGVGRGEALTVDVDGQTHGCVMFADSFQKFSSEFLRSKLDGMRMGDLRAPGFSERLSMYPAAAHSTGLFDSKQDKYSSYGRCGECRYLRTCTVCPVSIGNIPGNNDPRRVPDFLCAYNLVSRKYRELFPTQPGRYEVLTGRARMPRLMRELHAFVAAGEGRQQGGLS